MRFEFTNGYNQDFVELCRSLDTFLNELVGGEANRAAYVPYNRTADVEVVIVAYDDAIPVGCAGFKRYNDDYAEVKRVFVKPAYRGRGIAKALMRFLEDAAKQKGYGYLILESGEPLIAAMALYRSIGFKRIPNYGQYKDMPESICMQKKI